MDAKATYNKYRSITQILGAYAAVEALMNDRANMGALGMVVGGIAVVVALVLGTVIAGSIANGVPAFASGSTWNTTMTTLDSNIASAMGIGGITPLAIFGIGILGIVIAGLGYGMSRQ
jgi:hypothetical protein